VKLGRAPAKVTDCGAAHGFNPKGYCCFLEKERKEDLGLGRECGKKMNLGFEKVLVRDR
jgi:hypothetical protein